MPIKVIGDFKEGREIMKDTRRRHMSRIRSLEKKHDRLILNGGRGLPTSELKELNQLYDLIPFCSVSSMLPARVDGIIVNVKLLQRYIRKLRGYDLKISVKDNSLILEYEGIFKKSKGYLRLYDISNHFEGYPDIPELAINATNRC